MFKYRNEKNGREYEFPVRQEWLEASPGWSRVDEPEPSENDEKNEED